MRLFRLTLVASCASAAAAAVAQEVAEPPVAVEVGKGSWGGGETAQGTNNAAAYLRYTAEAFPRIRQHLFEVVCKDGRHEFKILGLLPAQSFPQPAVTLQADGERWSATPNARYVSRSLPENVNAMMPGKVGPGPFWPGYPPHAEVAFLLPREALFMPGLLVKGTFKISFAGQQRQYPAVPEALAETFVKRCAELASRRRMPPRP